VRWSRVAYAASGAHYLTLGALKVLKALEMLVL